MSTDKRIPKQSGSSANVTYYYYKILLVEDSPVVALATSRLLQLHGFEVDTAETAEMGIEMFLAKSYDIILMDIQLPGMDGVVALRKIRELEHLHDRSRTPVVAVTACTERSEHEMAMFDHVFIKPFLGNMADILYEKFLAPTLCETE